MTMLEKENENSTIQLSEGVFTKKTIATKLAKRKMTLDKAIIFILSIP